MITTIYSVTNNTSAPGNMYVFSGQSIAPGKTRSITIVGAKPALMQTLEDASSISVSFVSSDGNEVLASTEAYTTDDTADNVGGLDTCLALANSLKTVFNVHLNDQGKNGEEHSRLHAPLAVAATADDEASLIALTTELMALYVLHNVDAALATPVYHIAQGGGDALASEVAPTTTQECLTKLNDLKAKYNLHDADAVAHTTGSTGQEATADGANSGAKVYQVVAGAKVNDDAVWAILDDGVGAVTGVAAVVKKNRIEFEFSATPQTTTICSFAVFSR